MNTLEWTILNKTQVIKLVENIHIGQIPLPQAWTELDKLTNQMGTRAKWFEQVKKRMKNNDGSVYLTTFEQQEIVKAATQLQELLEALRDVQRELRGITCKQIENSQRLQAPKNDFS